MQCEIRERDSGVPNLDKTFEYYLIKNYDKTVTLLDKMDDKTKQQLCGALGATEASLKEGPHNLAF